MKPAGYALAAAGLLLAACSPPVKVVKVDAGSVVGRQAQSINPCRFRLTSVVDARSVGEDGGGLGLNQIKLLDAPAMVQSELLKSGLLPPGAEGRDVEVRLRYLYLSQNLYTKIPVAVYSVKAEGLEEFLIRAQPARMNWAGTQGEAVSALSVAIHEANNQTMAALNKACSKSTP